MMCGDRWLTTGSPWEGDEMTEREQFEKAFPVPDGAVWWDEIEVYCRKNKTTVHQYNDKWQAWQAARATPALPQAEHDLEDVRCQCCGYMTYHSEHMGCIRSAYKQALPQVPEGMAIVPVEFIHVLQDAPEINPSNYDHDQVCRLNTAVNEALAMLTVAKEKS